MTRKRLDFRFNRVLSLSLFDKGLTVLLLLYYLNRDSWRILGNDYNWDLLNYHLNNVTNSQPLVLHPAGIQSFFSPLLDFILLPIHTLIPAPISGMIMTFPFVLNFLIIRYLFIEKYMDYRSPLVNSISLIVVMPSMAISQLNNSMGDVVLTPIALLAIYRMVSGLKQNSSFRVYSSGLMFGILLGLKLSFAYLVVASGILLAFLVAKRTLKFQVVLKWIAFFAVGYFPLAIGHMFKLAREFGNPIFPFFNKIFRSPYFDFTNLRDERFGIKTVSDYFTIPIDLALGRNAGTAELTFRDVRLFFIMLVTALALLLLAINRVAVRPRFVGFPNPHLIAFVVLAYTIWGGYIGIARYMIPLEMLGLLFSFTYIEYLLTALKKMGKFSSTSKLAYIFFLANFLIALSITTTSVNWGHENSRSNQVSFVRDSYTLVDKDHVGYLLLDAPLAFLKYETRFSDTQLWFGPSFTDFDNTKQREVLKDRDIFTLSYSDNPDNLVEILKRYNLIPFGGCKIIQLRFNNGLTPNKVYLCGTAEILPREVIR